MKTNLMLFLLLSLASSGIKAQTFKDDLKAIEASIIAQDAAGYKKLVDFSHTPIILETDSAKALVYSIFLKYHLINGNNTDSIEKYCASCVEYALKDLKYTIASVCTHNKAVSYHFHNQIDTAIAIEQIALEYAEKGNDSKNYYVSLIAIAKRYTYLSKFKESNELIAKNIDKITDQETKSVALLIMAGNYRDLGAKIELDKYYLPAIANLKSTTNKRLLTSAFTEYCNYLMDNENFEKVLAYADSMLFYSDQHNAKTTAVYFKSRAYYGLKDLDKSLAYITEAIQFDTDDYNAYYLIDDYNVRGKIYLDKNELDAALADFKKAKLLFSEADDVKLQIEVLKYYVLTAIKQRDSELAADFDLYVNLKDSVYDAESNESLIDFEAKYRTAEKEAQIKSQQLEIEKEKAKRNMALAGGGFLILIAGLGFGYFRNKQKQKFLQTQNALLGLQQDLSFKEIESLNKQLDPHEIKNLLGSISPEIQEKAPEAYNNMVKLFKITKASLSKELVEPLNQQLEQIEDYLALEKNMLHVPLNYTISDNSINKNTPIPRLLLKNLVENAVKHGIRLSQSGGEISIEISEADNNLRIVVDDTGVGRKQAIAQDSGIGTSTYLRLFEILNLRNKEQAVFKTLDKNQGTRVQVNIPLNYKYTWK